MLGRVRRVRTYRLRGYVVGKYVIHFKDGSTEEVETDNIYEKLKSYNHLVISHYDDIDRMAAVKKAIEDSNKPKKPFNVDLGKAILSSDTRLFKVHSATSDQVYDVTVSPNGDIFCTCKGFGYRRWCWHSGVVRAYLEGYLKGDQVDEVASWEVKNI